MSPDRRQHRGAHPEDRRLFAPERLPAVRTAVADLSWLLERGYPANAALKLTGDRYALDERQHMAVLRAACGDTSHKRRAASCLPLDALTGQDVQIDGFNLLISVEAALGGGLILCCRDECLRDLASVHGTYKAVQETVPALTLIGEFLEPHKPHSVQWLLDSPVSNSGRLAQTIRDTAAERAWNWQAETVLNPDAVLKISPQIVVSSDSLILDSAARWVNLAAALLPARVPRSWIVDLRANAALPGAALTEQTDQPDS